MSLQKGSTTNPVVNTDKDLNNRFWIVQNVCDRLCEAHDKNKEFSKELKTLIEKYPLNYTVEYLPKEFVSNTKINLGCE